MANALKTNHTKSRTRTGQVFSDPFSAVGWGIDTKQMDHSCWQRSGQTSDLMANTYAPHAATKGYSAPAYLRCLRDMPLGCWTHCHSNCCRADFSCTSLKLIASHSIHFTNMCSNYYFAAVIIKRESIRNKREKMENIPGIATSALITTETEWPSFWIPCPRPVIWKEETVRLKLCTHQMQMC